MPIDPNPKIQAHHLQRDAFLYVRQSTLRQVFENTESTKRQYALRERAVALGWPLERIHTIDSDLGLSGAHAEHRDGFQKLVSEVALGHAGIVLGLEVSRLARNNADWQRLLELAALSKTLILDEDGIYDPDHFNDRLLLGLKGTMSEAELHVLKARLLGGQRSKARRGELWMPPPVGLVYDPAGKLGLDPDAQIQASVRWVFNTFRAAHSATAVVRRFRREGLTFPRRVRYGIGKGEVHWGPLDHSRTLQILHNPRYAGAFVYGRTRGVPTFDAQHTQPIQHAVQLARKDWQVVIPDAHAGYLSWAEFERNQVTLRQNALGFSSAGRGAVPREGPALLQGRVLCGRCGARMRVRYQQVASGLVPYYQCCEESVRRAGKFCQSIHGAAVDRAIGALLLERVAPAALEVALAVQDEIAGRIEQANALRRTELERARYEAELARRRYLKVDPDNRLVADALEADWNTRLRRVDTLQRQHEQQRDADQKLLGDEARARIRALAADFPRVWNDPRTEPAERKRMVALLIEDVTLLQDDQATLHVRFRGGRTVSLTVARPTPISRVRKTRPEVVAKLTQLLETCSDGEASAKLNALGYCNWKGEAFTAKRTRYLRRTYGVASRYQRLRARGFLTGPELAQQLGICISQLHALGRRGVLPRQPYGNDKRCLYVPIGDAKLVKGAGGRYRPRQPQLIPAPPSTQEAS
ncbi:MAG: recombinase family protein [Rhodanobacteraceae bacterium]